MHCLSLYILQTLVYGYTLMSQLILDTTSTPQTEYFQFNNHGINYHLNGKYTALKLKNRSEIYKSKKIQSTA